MLMEDVDIGLPPKACFPHEGQHSQIAAQEAGHSEPHAKDLA
jgi:hypothetical protein